jgi:hypothetical protein
MFCKRRMGCLLVPLHSHVSSLHTLTKVGRILVQISTKSTLQQRGCPKVASYPRRRGGLLSGPTMCYVRVSAVDMPNVAARKQSVSCGAPGAIVGAWRCMPETSHLGLAAPPLQLDLLAWSPTPGRRHGCVVFTCLATITNDGVNFLFPVGKPNAASDDFLHPLPTLPQARLPYQSEFYRSSTRPCFSHHCTFDIAIASVAHRRSFDALPRAILPSVKRAPQEVHNQQANEALFASRNP